MRVQMLTAMASVVNMLEKQSKNNGNDEAHPSGHRKANYKAIGYAISSTIAELMLRGITLAAVSASLILMFYTDQKSLAETISVHQSTFEIVTESFECALILIMLSIFESHPLVTPKEMFKQNLLNINNRKLRVKDEKS
jgi:hypothetical protein